MATRLLLKDRESSRQSLARALREFARDPEADVQRFRAMLHGFNTLLSYDRVGLDEDIIARIERLEAVAGDPVQATAARQRSHDEPKGEGS